jgi:hypothetical protein
MANAVAEGLMAAGAAWLATGLLVGTWFLLFGIDRRDPAARGAWAFRPLLLPGFALLWPLVLWRGDAGPGPGIAGMQRRRHALTWLVLAAWIAGVTLLALSLRQVQVPEKPSLRLSGIAAVSA